jgi:hypothetical protein
MSCQPCEERQGKLLTWANAHTTLLAGALGLLLALVWVPQILKKEKQ